MPAGFFSSSTDIATGLTGPFAFNSFNSTSIFLSSFASTVSPFAGVFTTFSVSPTGRNCNASTVTCPLVSMLEIRTKFCPEFSNLNCPRLTNLPSIGGFFCMSTCTTVSPSPWKIVTGTSLALVVPA